MIAPKVGSPPHMRGKADERVLVLLHYGITPAHAGKRSAIARLEAGDWDHPRTCGEKQTTSLDCLPFIGSPPHMRGKGKTVKPKIDKKRITPAHAGKSVYLAPVDTSLSGSPPHMRGKVVELFVLLVHHGITPAHAGKSLAQSSAKQVSKDHPRTCGEKIFASMESMTTSGSPPHMRGKV